VGQFLAGQTDFGKILVEAGQRDFEDFNRERLPSIDRDSNRAWELAYTCKEDLPAERPEFFRVEHTSKQRSFSKALQDFSLEKVLGFNNLAVSSTDIRV
jgi:hypothetical protein